MRKARPTKCDEIKTKQMQNIQNNVAAAHSVTRGLRSSNLRKMAAADTARALQAVIAAMRQEDKSTLGQEVFLLGAADAVLLVFVAPKQCVTSAACCCVWQPWTSAVHATAFACFNLHTSVQTTHNGISAGQRLGRPQRLLGTCFTPVIGGLCPQHGEGCMPWLRGWLPLVCCDPKRPSGTKS